MPLTEFHSSVLRDIAENRSPDSYLAGATVLHREPDSPRYSQDLDFFHDLEERVSRCAEQDASTLLSKGYHVNWLMRTPNFYRAVVTRGENHLKLEWAQDSTFRFFPVQKDAVLGYRLHDADAATNKLLAMAGRSEARDFVDILFLHRNYLSLGAVAWAACGKDPGFTPAFLLDQANRHATYYQADLDRLQLRAPLDLKVMKAEWISAREEALALASSLPPEELGCLYLGPDQAPLTPDPASGQFAELKRHRGSARGTWPTASPYRPED